MAGIPEWSILEGLSIANHPALGVPGYRKPHMSPYEDVGMSQVQQGGDCIQPK